MEISLHNPLLFKVIHPFLATRLSGRAADNVREAIIRELRSKLVLGPWKKINASVTADLSFGSLLTIR